MNDEYESDPETYWNERISSGGRYSSIGIRMLPQSVNEHRKKALFETIETVLEDQEIDLPTSYVLDAGCGTGVYSKFYAQEGATVQGVDISQEAIDTIHDQGIPGEYEQSELHNLRFEDDTFDLIHCFSVLYHVVNDKNWRESLSQLVRVTEPGGILLFRIAWRENTVRTGSHVKHRSINDYLEVLARNHGCRLESVHQFNDVVPYGRLLKLLKNLGAGSVSDALAQRILESRELAPNPFQRVVTFRVPDGAESQ